MSSPDRSERIVFLRETIARLERTGPEGAPAPVASVRVPLAGEAGSRLDRALGGGLPLSALHEVLPEEPADAPAALGFALALAARCGDSSGRPIVWVVEDFAAHEWGAPYGRGLDLHGLPATQLVVVRAADSKDALWVLEETLKSAACTAVVGEMWGSAKLYDLATSRRLAEAARRGGTTGLLVHPAWTASRCEVVSGARGRFAVAARRSASPWPLDLCGGRPLPGAPAFAVRLLKMQAEGGRAAPFDPERIHDVIWHSQERLFRDPSPLHLAAGSADTRAARRA